MKQTFLLVLVTFVLYSCKEQESTNSKTPLYQIRVGGRCGLIDSAGKIVVNPQFDDIYIPYGDKNYTLIAVRLGTKIGFIDRKGQFKINPQFDIDTASWNVEIGTEFSEGLAKVEQNNRFGYVDTTGKLVIKAQFDDCERFKEGLAAFKRNNKWGFINKKGVIAISPQFDLANSFFNGIAEIRKFAKKGEEYPSLLGYIDKTGKIIWQPTN